MIAVCSGAWGPDGAALAALTFASIAAYAERCGAVFVALDGSDPRYTAHWKKLRVRDLFGRYERVLWIDADCLVRPDCPDLFRIVPPGRWAAHDELERATDLEVYDRHQKLVGTCGREGLPIPDTHGRYFNTGVVMIPAGLAALYADPVRMATDEPCPSLDEQNLVNVRLHLSGAQPFCLPDCFNLMAHHHPPRRWESSAFVAHFAGGGELSVRLPAIQRLKTLWGV